MPLGDVTYQDAALADIVASWPATGANYHLFISDPALAATPLDAELTSGGGYAAVAFSPSDFGSPTDGQITTNSPIAFPTSTNAWDAVATYWGVVDSTGLLVYSDELTSPIEVAAAGTAAAFTPALAFTDGA